MRVKCIDNWMYEHLLKRNGIYKVIRETSDSYIIVVDRVGYVSVSKDKFIIEEDKMEEIRVVRKLEDLDGLPNGFGAKIQRIPDSIYMQVIVNGKSIHDFNTAEVSGENYFKEIVKNLKAMGFKIEYKPMRTEQEVKEEVVELTKDRHSTKTYKFLILKHQTECSAENYYYYKNFYYGEIPFGKACWLTEEEAKMYSKELNEIIKTK